MYGLQNPLWRIAADLNPYKERSQKTSPTNAIPLSTIRNELVVILALSSDGNSLLATGPHFAHWKEPNAA
jgi:hypothetical protein